MPTINISDVNLYYEIHSNNIIESKKQADRQTLLFIHGLGSSTQDWCHQVDAFKSTYIVVTIDVRGHGRSSKPAGPYSISQFADDLAGFINKLRLDPVHVIGLSMGGMIAVQLALDHPSLARTVTTVNAPPNMRPRRLADRLAIMQRKLLLKLFGMKQVGKVLAKRLFPDPSLESTRQRFIQHWARNNARAYMAALNAILNWCVTERLEELTLPLLVIAATEDYTPLDSKKVYLKMVPGATLTVISGSHHAIPMEFPDKFNDALARFLTRYR